jgi:pimeloyl-ACP methyl ester carboxylesterase
VTASATSAISHEFVAVNNIRLHVSTAGQRGAQLVIFLHGFPESSRSWRRYLEAMSGNYFAIAPDNRGFGESDKPASVPDYRMENIVADISGLGAHYGASKFILVGHDWGGLAAWHFAARHPKKLLGLIVLNAPHPTLFQQAIFSHAGQRAASQYVNRFRDVTFEAQVQTMGLEKFWMLLFGAQLAAGQISQDDKASALKAWSKPGALTAMLNWYRAADYVVPNVSAPLESVLESPLDPLHIAVKTMVIWGMRDTILLPCLLDGLDQYVPALTIKKIDDVGHGLIHERHEQIIAIINNWLKAVRI